MNLWKIIRPYLSGCVRFARISYLEAKTDYQGTLLGLLWQPLLTIIFALMLSLVFRHSDAFAPLHFFLYVLSGLTLWNFISDSIGGSVKIIQNRLEFAVHNGLSLIGLFLKVLMDRLFDFSLNFGVLILCVVVFSAESLGPQLLLLVPLMAMVIVSSLSISYLINLTTIYYPDFASLIKTMTRFMFFATPVFWSPHGGANGVRLVLANYNPAAYYLDTFRQTFGLIPFDGMKWTITAALTALLAIVGWVAYVKSERVVRNIK